MRATVRLLGLLLMVYAVSLSPVSAEMGQFQVTVKKEVHTIGYWVTTFQRINDLSDPTRFRWPEGVFSDIEVWDAHPTRIIETAWVEFAPTPRYAEGAAFGLPLSFLDPGGSGVNLFLLLPTDFVFDQPIAFTIKLTTGDEIRVAPFAATLHRLADIQNVLFLDTSTKPVTQWDSIADVQSYRVKVEDPQTGISLFQAFLPVLSGSVQTFDFKAPGPASYPANWPGMEVGNSYVIRVEGRFFGSTPVPSPSVVSLPFHKNDLVAAPSAGEGAITRSMRAVGYTPLTAAP